MPVPERPKTAAPPAPSAPSTPSAPAARSASSAPPTLRERRRATAVREILDAAELHITEHGPEGLSLRAVARSLGMTVQALYHYFPNRHALVTMLVTKGYEDLFAAVQAAVDSAAGAGGTAADSVADRPFVSRLLDAAEGYRRWAVNHPERFKLLFGTPLRGYAAPADGASTMAARRMSAIFQRELFGGFSLEQLAAADIPSLSPQFRAYLDHLPPDGPGVLPPPAIALLMEAWGRMHGMVVLEVFGHTSFLGDHEAELFHLAMRNMLADIHRRISGSAGAVGAGAV
ncbi:TetR/AcrR family transcriptional regulator [Streptomyces dangxiongensis]|uniref:TetR/AcrR family transcriptional regulator n=1 Tax=Streptomyces dangxiongensis TaxID=1442032 RepID=A0A3G2JAF0_9ACTN|nr:TetR/AcrR family transcriptional regulator [Streptomyces dangxiongensis]AYN38591.1 TetR/AcrR family transcriptional regulator [Streptomyces dangxiongensis]